MLTGTISLFGSMTCQSATLEQVNSATSRALKAWTGALCFVLVSCFFHYDQNKWFERTVECLILLIL